MGFTKQKVSPCSLGLPLSPLKTTPAPVGKFENQYHVLY